MATTATTTEDEKLRRGFSDTLAGRDPEVRGRMLGYYAAAFHLPWDATEDEIVDAMLEYSNASPKATKAAARGQARAKTRGPRQSPEAAARMAQRMGNVSHKRATVREGSITRFGVLQPDTKVYR